MIENEPEKVIIVEGVSDRKQIEKVITDHITILCTHGTFDIERFDELLDTYDLDHKEVYIMVDEDESGIKLRKQLISELPHAQNIYVSEEFKEVAVTPENILANTLISHNIDVNPFYLRL